MNKFEKYIYKATFSEASNELRTAWFKLFFNIVKELKLDKLCKWLNRLLTRVK